VLPLLELRRRVQQVNIVLKNLISHKIHIKKKKKKKSKPCYLKNKERFRSGCGVPLTILESGFGEQKSPQRSFCSRDGRGKTLWVVLYYIVPEWEVLGRQMMSVRSWPFVDT
jgi:hypothetical protein